MIKNFILNKTAVPTLSKSLDAYALRQKAISENIANVNTPGYRRQDVEFEAQLQSAIQKTVRKEAVHLAHIEFSHSPERIQPQVIADNSAEQTNGINNVNIDQEIVEQVKNEIRFLYATRMIRGNFAAIRASIKGRFDQ